MHDPFDVEIVFDEHGMPTDQAGLAVYADLLERIYDQVRKLTPKSGVLLFEVFTPQATRALLLRSGTDLLDYLRLEDDPVQVAFGLAVVNQGGVTDAVGALWGHRASVSAGGLALVRYSGTPASAPSSESTVRDIILLTRSGIRGVLRASDPPDSGSRSVRMALPGQGLLTDFTAPISMLEASLGTSTPESKMAPSMTVAQLIAIEVVVFAALQLKQWRTDSETSAYNLGVVAVSAAVARIVSIANLLAGVPPTHDATYVREFQWGMESIGPSFFDVTDVLGRAFRDCREIFDRDWVSVLKHLPAYPLVRGALPEEVIKDPSWGSSHLIGMVLAAAEFASVAQDSLGSLPEPARTLVVELLEACGCALPAF